jgi:hypothetical protein
MLTNVGDTDQEWYQSNTDEYEMMSVGHQQHQWPMLTDDW